MVFRLRRRLARLSAPELGSLERVGGLWASGALFGLDDEGARRVAAEAVGGLDGRSAVLCVASSVAAAFARYQIPIGDASAEFAARVVRRDDDVPAATVEMAFELVAAAHALHSGRFHSVGDGRRKVSGGDVASAVPLVMAVVAEMCAARVDADGVAVARRAAAAMQFEHTRTGG